MSPSRGNHRDGSGNTAQGGGYGFGYGFGNGNGHGYSNASAYGFAGAYGNGYGYGYTNGYASGNGYSEYEQQQYQQEQQQYQSEQYQPEQYQAQQYQQHYPQQHYESQQQYQQYQDGSYDMYNATQYQEPVQQRRSSPSYDAYDTHAGGSAARQYSTYSSSSSSLYRRPSAPQNPSKVLLMPTSSDLKDFTGAGGRSSPPPSPPPPPRRTEPTEEYLRASLEPSWHVDAPESARKLVVLDLNGSLLLRASHRRPPLPRYGKPQSQGSDPYADPTLRPVRVVHPRPYLTSFVNYIFHPTTRKWLDTMVWSSAQSHSVDDMVDRCLRERRKELRAVWARDTFGLTKDEFYKKSLTLKDLEKPWAELPFMPPLTSTNPNSPIPISLPLPTSPPTSPSDPTTTSPCSSPRSSPKPQSTSLLHHSARTTLLIDDSPLKAALQPWNHLVIREYVQEVRNMDLEVAAIEENKERESKAKDVKKDLSDDEDKDEVKDVSTSMNKAEAEGKAEGENQDVTGIEGAAGSTETKPVSTASASSVASTSTGIETESATPAETNAEDIQSHRTLKRLQKKEAGKLKRAEEKLAQMERGTSGESEGKAYDQTLLAVIGILDRVRWEGNVAGWMRSGGLVNVKEEKGVTSDEGVTVDGNDVVEKLNEEPETRHDRETERETGGKKGKTALVHTPPTKSRDVSPSPGPPSSADAISTSPTNSNSKKRRRVNEEKAKGGSSAVMDTSTDTSSKAGAGGAKKQEVSVETTANAVNSDQAQEKEEQAATGVPTASDPVGAISESFESTSNEPSTPKLWYEYPDILIFWAARGRKALAELGIEAESGFGRTKGT